MSVYFAKPFEHRRIDVEISLNGISYICNVHFLHINDTSQPKPCLLLLHGTASAASSFMECFDHLSNVFEIIALDLPGFGRTTSAVPEFAPKTPAETLDFFSQLIEEFLKVLAIDRVVVVAHSFGGFLATHHALRFPGRVSHLGLMDTAGLLSTLGDTGAYWAVAFKYSMVQIGRPLGRIGTWLFFTWFTTLGYDDAMFYWYSVLSHPKGWGDRCVAQFIGLNWTNAWWNDPMIYKLSDLRCHVATFYGEFDDIMPQHQGRLLEHVSAVPCAVIPETGHSPFHGDGAVQLSNKIIEWHRNSTCNVRAIVFPGTPVIMEDRYAATFSTVHTGATVNKLYLDFAEAHGRSIA